jgi:hypothetical protein
MHQPHLILVPDPDFRLDPEALLALQSCTTASRIIRIRPDCNEALVHDLSQVWLSGIGDLLALIPSTDNRRRILSPEEEEYDNRPRNMDQQVPARDVSDLIEGE